MTDRQNYLRAAKLIDSGKARYSCWAIEGVKGCLNDALIKRYQAVMGSEFYGSSAEMSWHFAIRVCCDSKEEERNLRVLLLCMMAACCEDFKNGASRQLGRVR